MARKNTLVTFTMLSTIMFFNKPTYAFLGTIGANLIMGSAGSSGSAPAPKTSGAAAAAEVNKEAIKHIADSNLSSEQVADIKYVVDSQSDSSTTTDLTGMAGDVVSGLGSIAAALVHNDVGYIAGQLHEILY